MDGTGFERRYEDCLRLFIEQGGRNVSGIERRMRVMGYARFSRRILYSRIEKGVYKPGWIERFGWRARVAELRKVTELQSYAVTEFKDDRNSGSLTSQLRNSATSQPSLQLCNFQAWLKRVSPGMKWDWRHQQLIYRYLEAITRGESKRLMIFLPPRHGKSELVTVRYTAWRMQQDPKMNVILGSYNQRLANRFSRKVRRVLAEAEGRSCEVAELRSYEANSGSLTSQPRNSATSPLSPQPRNSATPQLSRYANSESEWETRMGGGLRAVGVGGGVTGFGADLIVIDDPVKSRAEAESETFRDNVWEWFNDDIYTRLEPNGAIILIQTRWHEDDLAGRLLKEMCHGGEYWDVLALPALAEAQKDKGERIKDEEKTPSSPPYEGGVAAASADGVVLPSVHSMPSVVDLKSLTTEHTEQNTEKDSASSALSAFNISCDLLGRAPGEALCPERYDEEALEKLRRKLGSYSFSALFQQRPTPAEGGIFKRKWFAKIVDHAPPNLPWKRGWDLAVSTRTDADFTASFRCAFDPTGNLYIADGIRLRLEFPDQRRLMIDRLMNERNTEHGVELAIHGQAIIQDLRRVPQIRSAAFRGVRVATDKITRALPWAALAEEGRVILVRGPWNQDFIQEAANFPRSPHDDQIDAVSIAVKMLSQRSTRAYGF